MSEQYAGLGQKVVVVVNHGGFCREHLGNKGIIVAFDQGDSLDVRVTFDDGGSDWGRAAELRSTVMTLQDLEALRVGLAAAEAAYAENTVEKTMQTIRENQDTLASLYAETQVLARSVGKVFGFNENHDEFILAEVSGARWDSSSANC